MVQQAITFRVEDLDKLAGLLSGLVDLGVNNIDHVDFKASNMKEFQKKARAEDVHDAKEKEAIIAAATDQQAGKDYQITDNTSENNGPPPVLIHYETKPSTST